MVTTDMSITDRELGELSARVVHLESTLGELKEDMRAVRETLSEAKGGWKTLMLVAGMSATIGGFIVKIFPFLSAFPR